MISITITWLVSISCGLGEIVLKDVSRIGETILDLKISVVTKKMANVLKSKVR